MENSNQKEKSGLSSNLKNGIQRTWARLSADEINCYATDPARFYKAVEQKHGLTREEAEQQVRSMEREARTAA